MGEIVTGTIIQWNQDGRVLIRSAVPSLDRAILRRYDRVLIEFEDGRRISGDQRRKIYALLHEISEWSGDQPQYLKEYLKLDFAVNRLETLGEKMFSLSNCSMTLAREFLSHIIDFMIMHGVPSRIPLWEQTEDVQRYVFCSAMNRRCVVCGRHAEIHHMSGSRAGHGGNNWREKPQDGVMFLPLCRHHHIEIHNGEKDFLASYHLEPIPMTKEIGKVYGTGKKAFKEE